ncbi:MAG: inositol monophosphatase [Gemmatimonadetes bacterium]|nr:inositol monophosphatase [Gemmatimonadota bacterium]
MSGTTPRPDPTFADDWLDVALAAARAAADVHRRALSRNAPASWVAKGHSDWVSQVDHEAEAAAVQVIRSRFPDHAIVAEEKNWGGPGPERAPAVWYVDPLDGTTNFLHGYPVYAASVAVADRQGLRAAAVIDTTRAETFTGARARGAWLNGSPIRVSELSDLSYALLGTGFPFKALELMDDYLVQFKDLLPRTSGIRRTGSAAIDLCHVACGRLDGFWELRLEAWDIAGGALIVREAGGVITDLAGGDQVLQETGIIAGNPTIHRAILETLQRLAGITKTPI